MNYNKFEPSYGSSAEAPRRVRSRRRRAGVGDGKNRRWLFLAVDILLLVAILAAIFFLVVLLTPLDPFSGRAKEQRVVIYTVEFAGVGRDSIETLEIGDPVTDAETGSVIGEVVDVNSRAYEVYTDNPSDESTMTDNGEHKIHLVTKNTYPEEFQTVTVTIRVMADYEKGVGYWAEDCRIAVGRAYELHFPAYAGSGVCVTFAEE